MRTVEMWDHDTLVVDIRGFVKPLQCYSIADVARKTQQIIGIRSKQFGVKLRWKDTSDLWLINTATESVTAVEKHVAFTSWFRD